MKVSAAFLFAALAVTSAQDARRQTLKEQLMEHRQEMFVDGEVRVSRFCRADW
jgi:hypothetical protein